MLQPYFTLYVNFRIEIYSQMFSLYWIHYEKSFSIIGTLEIRSGDVVEWLTRRTSNPRIASRRGANPVRRSSCFLEQETLH